MAAHFTIDADEALPPLPLGTEIGGGCCIEKVLGRGTFGVTYQVKDPKTSARFALKEFAPSRYARRGERHHLVPWPSRSADFAFSLDRFQKEAEFLRDNGRHPYIVEVRGLFMKHGTAYMLMELVDGAPLESYLRSQIRLTQPQLTRLFSRISLGLAHLHAQTALHRDLKPANVMIRRNGEPVLIDFGAARRICRGMEHTQIFTPGYAAIEQQGREMGFDFEEGPWTDIFAMGTMAYEFATGARPNTMERARAIATGRPDPYDACANRASQRFTTDFCEAIDWACRLLPDQRPDTAEAWIDALNGLPISQRPVKGQWKPAPHLTVQNVREVAGIIIRAHPSGLPERDMRSTPGAVTQGPGEKDDPAKASLADDRRPVRRRRYLALGLLVVTAALSGLLLW